MAIRVRVNRLKLLARLEEVCEKAKKDHAQALKKYAAESLRARQAAARDLRKKADKMDDFGMYVASDTTYLRRSDRRIGVLIIESPVKIPEKPEQSRGLRDVERAIALLDQSDDERIGVSTADLGYYGIGSLAGLED